MADGNGDAVARQQQPRAADAKEVVMEMPALSHNKSALSLNPDEQIDLSWEDISFSVLDKRTKASKLILASVSGYVAPGEVLAIMGPSGSGKTTLLDFLAGRLGSGDLKGTVRVGGRPRDDARFKHLAKYVPQEDHLVGTLSVEETLEFSAELSLDETMSPNKKRERIDAVVKEMGLENCRHTRVGTVFQKGISGGQKRRLSVGVELLSFPHILLLDEPTSGLDAASALKLVQLVKNVAQTGRVVVMTIHQPSSEVFHMIDKLMLLSAGKQIYFGTTEGVVDYFARQGFPCPEYSNPADHVISLVNTDYEDKADEGAERVKKFADYFITSDESKRMRGDIAESTKHGDKMALRGMEVSDKEFSVGFLKQFWELSKRNLVDNARNPGVFWVRAAMYVMLSLMIGTFYLNIDNGQLEVSDRVSILFYVAAFMVFMSIAVIPTFIGDRAVFTRERGNGWYSEGPYVISNTLCAVPGIFLIALISSVLIYFMVGLNDKEGRFGLFLVNLFLSLLVAESLMLVLSALIPIYIIGMALGAGIFGLFMLAEGFFVLKDNIPDYWIWAYYIAFHTYSFEMFMYTEFDGLRLKCDTAICAFPTGEDVLARYDMKDVKVWVDVVVLIAMAVGYRLIFYGIIKYAQRGKR